MSALNVHITKDRIEVIVHYRIDVDSVVLERVYLALSDSWEDILPIIEHAEAIVRDITFKVARHEAEETSRSWAENGLRQPREISDAVAWS